MKKEFLILFFIFVFALLVRIINLNFIPNGLQLDELNAGYQGYKIITTGSDIFNNHLPLYINRFGDYRPAGIFYLSGLSILFFGFSDFAVRLPAALIGAITIFPLYFLTKLISKNKLTGFLSTILLAISPWHIVASRATSESVISLFFVLIGVFLLLKGIEKERYLYLFLSAVSFLASFLFYHTARVFVPSFLLLFLIFNLIFPNYFLSKKNKNIKISIFSIFIVILIITILISFTKFGSGRFSQTSIFSNKDIKNHLKALNDVDKGNIVSARVFHNKLVVYSLTFINQYFSYFSTEFLYVKGGLPQRYLVDDMGLFYYIEFPLLILGLYKIIRNKNIFFLVSIIWLIAGPLGPALTLEDSPNVQRSIIMIIPFFIIEAFGINFIISYFKSKIRNIILIFLSIIFLLNSIYFFHMYAIHSPSSTSLFRNDGNQELFSYLQKNENKYSVIYLPLSEDLPMYYLFYSKNNKELLSTTREKYAHDYAIGKFNFIAIDCPGKSFSKEKLNSLKNALFVDNGSCEINSNLSTIKNIFRKDSSTAYYISKKK